MALLFVPAAFLFVPQSYSLFGGVALLPWYCSWDYGIAFLLVFIVQCVSSCHSIGNCVGICFLLWSWQLHCVLFHGIFFRPWHWQLCLMLCCSIFLCAFVKQCAMAFFSMLQHCSIACYTAALALHLMQGAIVVIPHCSQ